MVALDILDVWHQAKLGREDQYSGKADANRKQNPASKMAGRQLVLCSICCASSMASTSFGGLSHLRMLYSPHSASDTAWRGSTNLLIVGKPLHASGCVWSMRTRAWHYRNIPSAVQVKETCLSSPQDHGRGCWLCFGFLRPERPRHQPRDRFLPPKAVRLDRLPSRGSIQSFRTCNSLAMRGSSDEMSDVRSLSASCARSGSA